MTVKELRQILENLDDNVEVKIGYGEHRNPIKFIMPTESRILYMNDPTDELVRTMVIYGKFDKED